jgi:hypothetical protein
MVFYSCTDADDTLQCLREKDYDTIEAINTNITSSMFYGGLAFSPIIDGEFIRQSPSKSFDEGKVNGVSTLTNPWNRT